jgi:hypothetical protein
MLCCFCVCVQDESWRELFAWRQERDARGRFFWRGYPAGEVMPNVEDEHWIMQVVPAAPSSPPSSLLSSSRSSPPAATTSDDDDFHSRTTWLVDEGLNAEDGPPPTPCSGPIRSPGPWGPTPAPAPPVLQPLRHPPNAKERRRQRRAALHAAWECEVSV